MAETCLLCSVYRPDSEPRLPHRPPVCDGDRNLLDRHLLEIANLCAELTNPEPPVVDRRRHERFGIQYFKGGREVVSLGEVWSDPLAAVNGVSPIPSRSKQPPVTGSRERPLPVSADLLDLKAPARQPNPTDRARDWPEDQVGRLSAATVLDQIVRDVRDTVCPVQHLPAATVDEMVAWLRNRVDDMCDRHPAIEDIATELRDLRGALRAAAGETEPSPEPCDGVTCDRCDTRSLFRRPGDIYRAECGTCGTLYNEDEYAALVGEQASAQRARIGDERAASLLLHN
jgi:hypothetical protein